jgi:ATP-dependent Clp protease protease subunit
VIALKRRLNEIMAKHTGQDFATIERDLERDNFMSAERALEYGIIDTVLAQRKEMGKSKD